MPRSALRATHWVHHVVAMAGQTGNGDFFVKKKLIFVIVTDMIFLYLLLGLLVGGLIRNRRHWRRHHDHPRSGLFLSYEPAQGPGNIAGGAAGAHWRSRLLGVLQGRDVDLKACADRFRLSHWRVLWRALGPAPVGSGLAQGVWHFAGNHWHPVTTVPRMIYLAGRRCSLRERISPLFTGVCPEGDTVIQMIM